MEAERNIKSAAVLYKGERVLESTELSTKIKSLEKNIQRVINSLVDIKNKISQVNLTAKLCQNINANSIQALSTSKIIPSPETGE